MKARASSRTAICLATTAVLAVSMAALAQQAGTTAPPKSSAASDKPQLSQEELDQLLASIALYPDSLLAQIFIAATYPLEVVEADRWVKQNSNLSGDKLTAALEKQSWDPSLKALVNFPQVLSMMSEKLDWTTKLGDAVIAQQDEVMATVQKLRAKAKAQGNLESTKEQTVAVQPQGNTQIITIESADPQIVYVPTYDPTVIYGSWWYPTYPPYYYYPPGYAYYPGIWFGTGFVCGAAWGYAWGDCDWDHHDIDIDIDRNTLINNRIDRDRYRRDFQNRNRDAVGGRRSWQFDPAHRKGVAYRDGATARRYGGVSSADAARARDAYRGRADPGRAGLGAGDAGRPGVGAGGPGRAGAGVGDVGRPGQGRVDAGAGRLDSARGAAGQPGRGQGQIQDRGQTSRATDSGVYRRGQAASGGRSDVSPRGGAFDGMGQGGNARMESQRGQMSRGGYSGGGGFRGGGMRGGGGRGGGGRR